MTKARRSACEARRSTRGNFTTRTSRCVARRRLRSRRFDYNKSPPSASSASRARSRVEFAPNSIVYPVSSASSTRRRRTRRLTRECKYVYHIHARVDPGVGCRARLERARLRRARAMGRCRGGDDDASFLSRAELWVFPKRSRPSNVDSPTSVDDGMDRVRRASTLVGRRMWIRRLNDASRRRRVDDGAPTPRSRASSRSTEVTSRVVARRVVSSWRRRLVVAARARAIGRGLRGTLNTPKPTRRVLDPSNEGN